MQFEIVKNPMSMLEVTFDKDEVITAEAGALVYMMGGIEIKTKMRHGGLFKNLKVMVLGRESFFVNDFVAQENQCHLGLSGPPVGDIIEIPITSSSGFIVQSGSYIASTSGIELDTKWQGFTKGLFGTEFFMLKALGNGSIFCNAYGGLIEKHLQPGEKILIDNYHLVALNENMEYKVRQFGGLKNTVLGGEGLVTEITGPGTVFFQTKNLKELIDLLGIRSRQETRQDGINFGGFRIP